MEREKKVIDASVVAKWFLNEPDSEKALKLRDGHANGKILLIVPELIFIEVLNALRYKEHNIEALKAANKALSDIQFHVEKINPFLLEKSIQTALKYDLTLYDALYITLSNAFGIPLITADKELLKVPNTEPLY